MEEDENQPQGNLQAQDRLIVLASGLYESTASLEDVLHTHS